MLKSVENIIIFTIKKSHLLAISAENLQVSCFIELVIKQMKGGMTRLRNMDQGTDISGERSYFTT